MIDFWRMRYRVVGHLSPSVLGGVVAVGPTLYIVMEGDLKALSRFNIILHRFVTQAPMRSLCWVDQPSHLLRHCLRQDFWRLLSGHLRASLTNCNVFWTLLHGLSLAPGSMIEDCHIYCILSCTGWTSRRGPCISLLWWSTDLHLVICFYWSHDIISEHSAIGLFLWLARRSGTHWQMNCELTHKTLFTV